MTAELCYIGKTGTYRIPPVSSRLMSIATFVGKDATKDILALVFVSSGVNAVPYIFSSRPTNTGFIKWDDNLKYIFVAGYGIDERLAFCIGSKVYHLVDLPAAEIYLYFKFQAIYSITVVTRNVAPDTYVTYITTDSTIHVNLQYNNHAISMQKTWYCRLKVYGTRGKNKELVHTSKTVTVASTATGCVIPKIDDVNTGTISGRPIELRLEYSFDKSNWTPVLLHEFPDSNSHAIACEDITAAHYYLKEVVN